MLINKEEYLKKTNDKLLKANLEDKEKILDKLIEKIPQELYELSLCIIDDVLGNINVSSKEINTKYKELKKRFKSIENREVSFQLVTYTYDYCGDDNYEYRDKECISKLLKEAFDYGVYLVNIKQYDYALKVFDLIIYTNYSCLEVYDLEDYYDEIDYYDMDLTDVEDLLQFDLSKLYSYAIYAAYFCGDRYFKIYNYLLCYSKNTFEDSKGLGIEKMENLNDFYKNWIDFLTEKSEDLAERLIKEAMLQIEIDEYMICKKCFKTHPNLYKEYILKLLGKTNYKEIIELYEEAIEEITDLSIRKDISYITIDAINYSNSKIDKSKYYYCIFESDPSIPNFLVILSNNLYNDNIKNYVNNLEYNENKYASIIDKSYYDYFLGDFKAIYINKYNKNILDNGILYLMMLYLCDTKVITKIKERVLKLLTTTFDEYHYRNLNINMKDKYLNLLEKFDNWKQKISIEEELKQQFIDKIQLIVCRKTSYILENKHRGMYNEAAMFVVLLDEMLSNNKYIEKGDYINRVEKEYIRFNAFRRELKEYK